MVGRCASCQSLHSQISIDHSLYYRNYPFKRQKVDFAAKMAFGNRLRQLQKRGMLPRHRILDYGCGAGLFIDYLKSRGYGLVSGYDMFVEQYSNAASLETSYDVVISQDVVEHMEDPREFFRDVKKCLKSGGLLAVGTPNAGEIVLSDPETFLMELHQPYHRHLMTVDTMKQLGAEFGLQYDSLDSRFYYDTLIPTVNASFIKQYVRATGNIIDVAVESPQIRLVLSSPSLWLTAFIGYFYRAQGNMTVYYRNAV